MADPSARAVNEARYLDHLERWYELETTGALIAHKLADAIDAAGPAPALRTLSRLEKLTADWIAAALVEAGRTPTPRSSDDDLIDGIVAEMVSQPWRVAMGKFRDELATYVDELLASEDSAPPRHAALARHLTLHEEAWLRFAEREAGGTGDHSAGEAEALIAALTEPDLGATS